ncbi:hypothetical protein K661_02136 [Piscirickettsia salmonis LF-89 = ATCC VR-1361]|nr:hypothetical protein K661_02136 [Piscirickettsia salmonis LF-89 = ATCC VR-1361]
MGSNGATNPLKTYQLFLMALTHQKRKLTGIFIQIKLQKF